MNQRQSDIIPVETAGTLDGLFLERVRRSSGLPAYHGFDRKTTRWQTHTWAETAAQVGRWQSALAAENLQPGDRVAISLRNCHEWVCFDQAALGLGLVVVPLYLDDRPDNVAYILKDSGSVLLLTTDGGSWRRLAPHVEGSAGLRRVLLAAVKDPAELADDPRLRLLADWLPASAAVPAPRRGDPHALASIVYTSGTTGRPKGVMLSHFNMLAVAHASLQMADCLPDDSFLSFLPLSHTLERTGGYYLPMMAGASVAFARSVNQLAEDLQTLRPTMLIAVPRVFERVYGRIQKQLEQKGPLARWLMQTAVAVGWQRFEVEQGRARWSPRLLAWPLLKRLVADKVTARLGGRLRMAVSGGAPLGLPVARLFIGLGVPLLQGYGLTETSPVLTFNRMDDNDPASVGLPLPGVELRIGEDQELLAKTPGRMLGYWNNPEATAAIIDAEGWLHTGDQAAIRDGHVYITGRIKDVLVLSNGEKVPPADMEGAITLDGLFDHALIVGEGRPFLSALLGLNPEAWSQLAASLDLDPASPAALEDPRAAAALADRVAVALQGFPGYAKVRRVVATLEPWSVENGLLTPTMKLKRSRVLEHYRDAVEVIYAEGPTGGRRQKRA